MATTAEERMPTRLQALAFRFKATCFRTKRTINELGKRPCRQNTTAVEADAPILSESRSLLYPNQSSAEFALQAGKVHNLRIAAQHLNGIVLPAGETFSFWAHVPRPTSRQGFVAGRELREGCIIPSVGGGLCQLSNALYDAALKANFEIVERHGHSRVLPGSMAESGKDATVFWNYVDLRFRTTADIQFEVTLGRGELVVRMRKIGDQELGQNSPSKSTRQNTPMPGDPVESCETCGVTSCFRHPEAMSLPSTSVTAWLVDAYWPEHDIYMSRTRSEQDWLFTPMAGHRYHWHTDGFTEVKQARMAVIRRSIVSRKLASQGAARQRALLAMDEKLAQSFAKRIPYQATHLVVSQNLLPFLWRDGLLGGRTFDVLMTRLPIKDLQASLDAAAARWPESPTLADFRVEQELVDWETTALKEARHWITPHSEIARIAGDKALKLDWYLPEAESDVSQGDAVLFPASTLGRKGAWEMREIGGPVNLAGPILESPDFWTGHNANRTGFDLNGVGAVVLPAWSEHQPRRLLQAIANDIPVIASKACGLSGMQGVSEVEMGDVEALKASVEAALNRSSEVTA